MSMEKATVKLSFNADGYQQITLEAAGESLTGLIPRTITEITSVDRLTKDGVMFFACNLSDEEIYDFTVTAEEVGELDKWMIIFPKIAEVDIR